jgi:hypothetical protein
MIKVYDSSVASVKIPELFIALTAIGDVRMIPSSEASTFFLNASKEYNPAMWTKFVRVGGLSRILSENLEWRWKKIGDPVFHIEVRYELLVFSKYLIERL